LYKRYALIYTEISHALKHFNIHNQSEDFAMTATAEQVVRAAIENTDLGKQPDLPYINEQDPTKAVRLAVAVLREEISAILKDALHAAQARGKSYSDMTDEEIKAAARNIVRTSSSEAEIQQRIRDEIGYPYGVSLCIHMPDDSTGREARELVRSLGGLVTKNGAMVMGMMHGHEGTISL
jgi:hypothetical protein